MKQKTILVCGAYGQAGRGVVHELIARTDFKVIATGRNVQRLEQLQREINSDLLAIQSLDVDERNDLVQGLTVVDLVINCVGPYIDRGHRIAEAAIEAGVHYLDIAAEQEHYRRLLNLRDVAQKKGVALATGFGFYPGLSGLLLLKMKGQLEDADSCRMSLYQARQADASAGAASMIGAVVEMCYEMSVVRDGRLTPIFPCAKVPVQMPEPFGNLDTMLWPQSEILSLTDSAKLRNFEISTKIGLEPIPSKAVVNLVRFLKPHKRPRVYNFISRLMRKRNATSYYKSEKLELDPRAIVMISLCSQDAEIKGTIISDTEEATASLPVKAVGVILEGQFSGLLAPQSLFDPNDFFAELKETHPQIEWNIDARILIQKR